MKTSEYWRKRFEAIAQREITASERAVFKTSQAYEQATAKIVSDLELWYRRLAKNNDISFAEVRKLLSDNELKEFHWTVDEYIKYGQENAMSQEWLKQLENASARIHITRLDAQLIALQHAAESLATITHATITDHLAETFRDSYYRSVFEIEKGFGVGTNFARLSDDVVDKAIRTKWTLDSKMFSNRIWEDKDRLMVRLETDLTQMIARGESPENLIGQVAKDFGTSKANAGRLIMTESAAVSAKARQECFNELDVEEYEIVATLDRKTSNICQDLDKKVFKQSEYEIGVTAPPFHPNCRTDTAPVPTIDIVSKRAARDKDGNQILVPTDMSYKDWYTKFIEPHKEELAERDKAERRRARERKKQQDAKKAKTGN